MLLRHDGCTMARPVLLGHDCAITARWVLLRHGGRYCGTVGAIAARTLRLRRDWRYWGTVVLLRHESCHYGTEVTTTARMML